MNATETTHQSPLLAIKNLQIDFNTPQGPLHAVRDISLELYPHQLLALVGESGSGKSVTAHAILQLLPPNAHLRSGEITFQSHNILKSTAEETRRLRGNKIAIIFQEPTRSFDPLYPLGKIFREAIRAHTPTATKEEIERRTLALLTEVSIPNPTSRLSNYPAQFSGGQLQRINIALSLISDPHILIADEPTTALDLTTQAEIIALLQRLQAERDLAILFISHDIELVAHIADQIAVMYAGRLLECGSSATLLATPHHPYTAALLRSTITIGQHYTRDTLTAIEGTVPDPYHRDSGCPFAPRCEYVRPECRAAIPPWQSERTRHRCVVQGAKAHL